MSFANRRLFVASFVLALFAAPLALAQNTRTWTGQAAPNGNWTTLGNWNSGVPISGDTALFSGTGNNNRNISLGGAARPIKNILFDTSAFDYTLGALSSGDKFNFDAGGAITVNSTIGSLPILINADVQTNGALTVTNTGTGGLTLAGAIKIGGGGTLTFNNITSDSGTPYTITTLSGNITDIPAQPGSLSLLGSITDANNSTSYIITGTNTYTGPTTIQVNTSGGSIQLGSDSPFGQGIVTVNSGGVVPPYFSALGGDRTIGNAFNVNSNMTFTGGDALTFTGPFTIINSASGGTRTLANSPNTSFTFGANPGSSTITLGNPAANGGDGIGKGLVFAPSSFLIVVNDVMQDPAPGGGTHSGSLQYSGSGGITRINSLNTYTGPTLLNGVSTVQFTQSYNTGDPSGPFGVGTLTPNSPTNNILQPFGGDRTIANPVSMVYGLTVSNAPADTSSLTLTGPISMLTAGRFITNNFFSGGGTLTLGSAASPSTITLPTAGNQTMTIAGTGATVINDVIQNPTSIPSPAPAINVTSTGTTTLNALNTYTGDTTLSGNSGVLRIGTSSNALPGPSFTAGPIGTGTLITNATTTPVILQPFGADRTVANAINMPFGFAVSNPTLVQDPTGNHNLTLTGPITLGATGRIITNNLVSSVGLTLGSAATPSTISLGSTLTIQAQVGGGSTIINDAVTGVGGFTVQNNAIVQLNGTSSYTGATFVTGTGTPKLFVNGSKTNSETVTIDSVGTLGGTGSIAGDITNSGKIAPGPLTGIGALTATGTVSMYQTSHLEIELSGATSDKLVVGGNLYLFGSSLDVTGVGQGLSWVIATYHGLLLGSQTFSNVTSGYTVNYGTGANSQITLNKAPSGVNGDFNNDGKVDAGDYITWKKNNSTGNALPNDNGLGTPISSSHYTLWRSNYGKPPGSGSGSLEGGGTVPEPASLLLVLVGIVGLSATRARSSRRVSTICKTF